MSARDDEPARHGRDPVSGEALSGFQALVGYRLVEWREGFCRMAVDLDARHRNRAGAVHGGLYAVVADSAGGYCGCFSDNPGRARRCVTLSLTTQFLAQPGDGLLLAEARRAGGGRSIFFAEVTLTDGAGAAVASASGVYRYVGENRDPRGAPPSGG